MTPKRQFELEGKLKALEDAFYDLLFLHTAKPEHISKPIRKIMDKLSEMEVEKEEIS